MKNSFSFFKLVLPVIVVAAFATSVSADPGARPMAMGGAFTAAADDAYSTYYNPAGLATGTRSHLTYSGKLNRRSNMLPAFNDYFGASFSYELNERDTIAAGVNVLRDRHNELWYRGMRGRQKDRHANLALAYRYTFDRWYFGKSISVGSSLKYMRRTVRSFSGYDEDSDGRFSWDAGIIWELGAGFNLGVASQNINRPTYTFSLSPDNNNDDRSKRISERRNLRTGIAWKSPAGLIFKNDVFTVSADLEDVTNETRGELDGDVRVGAEWVTGIGASEPGRGLALRAGGYHINNSDLNSATGGVGYRSDAGWSIDYTAVHGKATRRNFLHIVSAGYMF